MCQLTLLDFQDARFTRFVAKPLTELNTIGIEAQSNNDGFGYVCFNNLDVINKSKESAQNWWNENWQEWKRKHKNPNGLYHVRAASFNTKVENEFSHPFSIGSLIMIHNGTLNYRGNIAPDDKLLKGELDNKQIDSYNFLKTLSKIVEENPPLNVEHINKNIKNWVGTFAIMVMDKRNPTKVFIIRDKEKPLYSCIFKSGKTSVGFIINTREFELQYAAELVLEYASAYNVKLSYEIEKLDDLKIWEYELGSFSLPKESTKVILPHIALPVISSRSDSKYPPQSYPQHNSFIPNISYDKVASFSEKLGLAYIEIMLLSELLFNQSFFTFDESMMDTFADFLEYLSNNNNFKGRKKIWLENLQSISRLDYYSKTSLQFPFFLNSKKSLHSEITSLKNRSELIAK